MFPLFYVQPKSRRTSFLRKEGYFPVVNHGSVFCIQVSEDEFEELQDRTWVTTTFKNMIFLDQCYWN
jgi:hypothetical protein